MSTWWPSRLIQAPYMECSSAVFEPASKREREREREREKERERESAVIDHFHCILNCWGTSHACISQTRLLWGGSMCRNHDIHWNMTFNYNSQDSRLFFRVGWYKNPVVPQFHKQRRHAEATLAFQHLMDSRWGTLFMDVLAVNLLVVPNSVCFFYPTMWKPLWPSRKYHDTCLILILLIHLDTCDTLIQYPHCCITLFLSLSPIWLVFSRMQIAEPHYNGFKWIKVVWMLQWWPSWGNVLEFACCSQHLCVN